MSRLCARPGCSTAASATLSYDYRRQAVWLDYLSEEAHPMTHDLCTRHADRLSVPTGWEISDARRVTDLFPSRSTAAVEPLPRASQAS